MNKADALSAFARMKARHVASGVIKSDARCGMFGRFDAKVAVMPNEQSGAIIRATASTDFVDLDDEVLIPGGADTSYLTANRSVFVDHWYDLDHCVGKVKELRRDPATGNWVVDVRMLANSPFPYVGAVVSMANDVGIGMSVGFDPIEWGTPTKEEQKLYPRAETIIRKWKMLEVSFTAIPCNVTCQSQSVTFDGVAEEMTKRAKECDRKIFRVARTLVVA